MDILGLTAIRSFVRATALGWWLCLSLPLGASPPSAAVSLQARLHLAAVQPEDFEKYAQTGQEKVDFLARAGGSCLLGMVWVMSWGPGGVVPLGLGAGIGIVRGACWIARRRMRHALEGAAAHLETDGFVPSVSPQRAKKAFEQLLAETEGARSDGEEGASLLARGSDFALRLLIANHLALWLLPRYNRQRKPWWEPAYADLLTRHCLTSARGALLQEELDTLLARLPPESSAGLAGDDAQTDAGPRGGPSAAE